MKKRNNLSLFDKVAAGFTMLEMLIAGTLLAFILFGISSTQLTVAEAFKRNAAAARPMQDINRVMDFIDKELRMASGGSLAIPGGGTPAAGTNYNTIFYRPQIYNVGAASTVQEAASRSISFNGNILQHTAATGATIEIARNITNFSVNWDSATNAITVTVQITITPRLGQPFSRTVARRIFLRN